MAKLLLFTMKITISYLFFHGIYFLIFNIFHKKLDFTFK